MPARLNYRLMSFYFVSNNNHKFSEYDRIFKNHKIALDHLAYDVDEIQTMEIDRIIKDKARKAYARARRDVIVEHASLSLSALNGLPKGFSKPFWSVLINSICEIARGFSDKRVEMTVTLAHCDGKQIRSVSETVQGTIADTVKPGPYHLDTIFIPNGQLLCLSEMGPKERDRYSSRGKTVAELANLIKSSI